MGTFNKELSIQEIKRLEELARLCRGDILKMTTIAGSGHPGGSMSSIDIYLTLYSFANISPENYDDPARDRIVISHGHTSPGLYSCLARLKFFDLEELLVGFRKIDSPYEGHIERELPGVEWSTGNLGQGLSAGCGFALSSRLNNLPYNVFVVMSDAEQAKGQVAEARRFATKFNLNNITVIIDYNHLQISGRVEQIMPVNIKDDYLADGWKVLEISGHDFSEIYDALRKALADNDHHYVIIAETIMGKGVSFMEGERRYHGKPLKVDECRKALKELGVEDNLDQLFALRDKKRFKKLKKKRILPPNIKLGEIPIYTDTIHPRNVFGDILEGVAQLNPSVPIAVFDCDLTESVRTHKFAKILPSRFFETGVSEHNTATVAGALSVNGVITIWGDFGVFGIDEVYNQLRLNDINHTNLKIFATHLGLNVGPDGKTHHCIDYIGILRNLFGFKLIIPGDPNQVGHIVRYILNQPGNFVVGVGRTKLPIIKTEDNKIFFDRSYQFEYGKVDLVRPGKDMAIFTLGPMLNQAVKVWEELSRGGVVPQIYNVSAPLDIDKECIIEASKTGLIITYEDHIIESGLGSIIAQIIAEEGLNTRLFKIGISEYGGSDKPDDLYKTYSLDAESVVKIIKSLL